MHETILQLLRLSGLSARRASVLAGLDPTFISRLLAVRSTVPKADALIALAHVFGTTADYLFAQHGEPPTPDQIRAAVQAAQEAAARKAVAA
jgi:transcriptional regulator with XRE-family HTH domain